MRHFAHNIGDYAAATAHLSFIEDAAYHRLLRRYYQDEKPLPTALTDCQRLVGARTKEEREAVRVVLEEFFTLHGDGWHQSRADREIAVYRSKAQAARENGTKGGRPANREKTKPVSAPVQSEKLTTPHSPLPISNPNGLVCADAQPTKAKRAMRLPEDWTVSEAGRAYANGLGLDPDKIAEAFSDYWRAQGGSNARKLDWDAAYRTWCRRAADDQPKASAPRQNGFAKPTAPTMPSDEPWDARINGWREKRFWLPMIWGPAPDQPGTRVPVQLRRMEAAE